MKAIVFDVDDTLYDFFDNDIAGAKRAGWKAVRYNHRGHQATGDEKPDVVVHNEEELSTWLEKMVEEEA